MLLFKSQLPNQLSTLDGLDPRFNRLPAAGSKEYFHLAVRLGRRALDLKIDGDFFQRVRDVLIRFQRQLGFHIVFAQSIGHVDHLGNDRRPGDCRGDIFQLRTRLGDHGADGIRNALHIIYALFDYRI